MSFFHALLSASSIGINPYETLLEVANASGASLPTEPQRILGANVIDAFRNADIWNNWKAFYVFATNGDSDFATFNWRDPLNYRCLKMNSPTFVTNEGFYGNDLDMYLDTQLPLSDLDLQNTAFAVKAINANTGQQDRSMFGAGDGTKLEPLIYFNPKSAVTRAEYFISDSTVNILTLANGDNHYVVGRAGNTKYIARQSGAKTTVTTPYVPIVDQSKTLHVLKCNAPGGYTFDAGIQYLGVYQGELTSEQTALIYTTMLNYLAGL